MRKYLQAYLDAVGSGYIDDNIIKRHIEQQALIDSILPDSASFFYVVEAPTHTYHFMGKQQENVSGYTNEEFLDKGIELLLQRLHPEDIDILLNQVFPDAMGVILEASPEDKKRILTQFNYRFCRKSGEYINLLEQIYVLEVDENGAGILFLGNVIVLDNSDNLPIRLSSKIFRKNQISETIFSKIYTRHSAILKLVTDRELDILRNLAAGKRSKEIAEELFISPHTVDTHRRNLLNKLKCSSVVELARFAFQHGLL